MTRFHRRRGIARRRKSDRRRSARKKTALNFRWNFRLERWTTQGDKFVTGIFRDVTERKQIAEAINEQRIFLRQVIDIDPNFIFAKDREGPLHSCQPSGGGRFRHDRSGIDWKDAMRISMPTHKRSNLFDAWIWK